MASQADELSNTIEEISLNENKESKKIIEEKGTGWGEEDNGTGWGDEDRANEWGTEDKTGKEDKVTIEDEGMLEDDYEAKLEIQQNDPNSNLFSAISFEDLNLPDHLLKGIYAMKYHKPSRIQSVALPMILSNPPQNVIGQAQSGSGKTAAFALGMLYRIDTNLQEPQAICVAPSRELATQILESVKKLGQFTNATYCLAVPETQDVEKGQPVKRQIIIGTPGYIENLMKRRTLHTEHIKIFVLDEADFMVEEGSMRFRSTTIRKNIRSSNYQTLLFSATFAPEVKEFAQGMVSNPNIITVKREQLTLDGIKQYSLECQSEEEKYKNLADLYTLLTIGKSVIFVQTRNTCKQLTQSMRNAGHSVGILHGADMDPSVRDKIIQEFRNGTTKTLITTNVLARGIDVHGVTLVINFDVPVTRERTPDYETYLHRIGRTGRFGRKGCAINFVCGHKDKEIVEAIKQYYEHDIVDLPTNNLEEVEKIIKSSV